MGRSVQTLGGHGEERERADLYDGTQRQDLLTTTGQVRSRHCCLDSEHVASDPLARSSILQLWQKRVQ